MGQKIAFLGLGAMGSRMAARLLEAGYDLSVFNRTPDRAAPLVERGASFEDSPRAAAAGCDIVISMVRDDEASREIWLDPARGALVGLSDEAIAIESSTLTPAWVEELHSAMAERQLRFIDAPVVGTRPQAEAGQLIYLVGGDVAVLERVRAVLLTIGGAIHHAGPIGAGTVMKLAVNALFGIQVAALGEVLGMTRRSGISDADAIEALSSMPVTSPALKGVGALVAARKFDPMFPIELVDKDMGYYVKTAERVGSNTPIGSAVRAVYQQAIEAGFGGDNIAGVAKVFD
jgi:3-hydroxyisobutyrate dehydrogenase-like beta-hydroxyacid dehydrogenase